ncbi:MAG: phospholipase D-like domain-containing protein [Candidatus Liptonbacteria bacterium]|nr:phospholipase D-like domain-containing protein [Candidatus Liptonbacteria bacterium]
MQTTWKFFLKSSEAWDSMLADIALAKTSIDIEQYIIGIDAVSKRFFELLKKKKSEGVAVRLLCDGAGSFDLLNSAIANELLAKGMELKFFNPIKPWRIGNFSSWFLRDHRKLMVVDKKIGHVGGVGIEKRMENWRDTHVRIEGDVVEAIQSAFDKMWGPKPKRILFRFRKPKQPEASLSFLTNAPRFRGRYIYHAIRRAIRGAKRYAYFTSPYFVPSIRMFAGLIRAAKRGVDVRLLLPESSDVRVADIAAGSYFNLALKAGVKIYLYNNGRILHAKTGVIDGRWGTVGSANLDNLSLLLNYEGNLVSTDQNFVGELKRQFMEDLQYAKEVSYDVWTKRTFFRKALEFLTWPIHQIL